MKRLGWAMLAAVVLAAPASGGVRQDSRSGPALATDLVESPSGLVLTTRTSVESLTGETEVALEAGRVLRLTPGIRFTRLEEGYSLATHDGRKIEVDAGTERIALPSPVIARLTSRGWEFGGGQPYAGPVLAASRHVAEELREAFPADPQQDRRQPKTRTRTKEAGKKLRVRWLYSEDPMPTAEVFNTEAIQQLVHLSALGF